MNTATKVRVSGAVTFHRVGRVPEGATGPAAARRIEHGFAPFEADAGTGRSDLADVAAVAARREVNEAGVLTLDLATWHVLRVDMDFEEVAS